MCHKCIFRLIDHWNILSVTYLPRRRTYKISAINFNQHKIIYTTAFNYSNLGGVEDCGIKAGWHFQSKIAWLGSLVRTLPWLGQCQGQGCCSAVTAHPSPCPGELGDQAILWQHMRQNCMVTLRFTTLTGRMLWDGWTVDTGKTERILPWRKSCPPGSSSTGRGLGSPGGPGRPVSSLLPSCPLTPWDPQRITDNRAVYDNEWRCSTNCESQRRLKTRSHTYHKIHKSFGFYSSFIILIHHYSKLLTYFTRDLFTYHVSFKPKITFSACTSLQERQCGEHRDRYLQEVIIILEQLEKITVWQ